VEEDASAYGVHELEEDLFSSAGALGDSGCDYEAGCEEGEANDVEPLEALCFAHCYAGYGGTGEGGDGAREHDYGGA
jgi:hypothetical protein